MASMTIRNIDEGLKKRLRLRAAENGRSLEAEVREVLNKALPEPQQTGGNLFDDIRKRFEPFGGIELKLPRRGPLRKPPKFK